MANRKQQTRDQVQQVSDSIDYVERKTEEESNESAPTSIDEENEPEAEQPTRLSPEEASTDA